MSRGHRPPTTKGPAPRPEKPSPTQRLQTIEHVLHSLITGDLHGMASTEDLGMISHMQLKLKALRLRLETYSERRPERRPTTPTTRRQKP